MAMKTMADVQKIKDEFIELHNQVPELISDDALQPLLEIVKDTKLDLHQLVKTQKKNIRDELLKMFLLFWDTQKFDVHLGVLEDMKKKHVEGTEKAWRPTGKTPEEQIRGVEYKILKNKITYLDDLIKEQHDELTQILPEIESNRNKMKNLLQQREATLRQLESNHEHYKDVQDDINSLRKKLHNKIIEIS